MPTFNNGVTTPTCAAIKPTAPGSAAVTDDANWVARAEASINGRSDPNVTLLSGQRPPVLTDAQAAKGGQKSTGGDAAPVSQ